MNSVTRRRGGKCSSVEATEQRVGFGLKKGLFDLLFSLLLCVFLKERLQGEKKQKQAVQPFSGFCTKLFI